MGDLNQYAHAVAHLAGGVLSGPVLQPLHNGQSIIHNGVAGNAVDAHHGADAAGVVFKIGRIKGVISLACFHEKPPLSVKNPGSQGPRICRWCECHCAAPTRKLRNGFLSISGASLHHFVCSPPGGKNHQFGKL